MSSDVLSFENYQDAETIALRKARNWIARWRAIGGGFQVHQLVNEDVVTLVRRGDDRLAVEQKQRRQARGLETELSANEQTRQLVTRLALDAHREAASKRIKAPANDTTDPEPAA